MASPFILQIFPFKNKLYYPGLSLLRRKISHDASLNQNLKEAVDNDEKQLPVQEKQVPENALKTDILRNSLKHPDFFELAELFTVEDLFRANVHLGHRDGTLNNYMKPYIFGSRLGHLIIDLDQTCSLLRDALNFTAHIAFRGGIILFVGRLPQHQAVIEKAAERCQEFSHTRIWNPLTLTKGYRFLDTGVRLPDTLLFFNTKSDVLTEHPAVIDAARMLIPSVGIVDTNCDPRLISYPVPGNDDTALAVHLYCELFTEAILRGKRKRRELLQDT